MMTTITVGFVQVTIPLFDCDGVQRVICFPRIGTTLASASPLCHWTANQFIKQARPFAKKALAEYAKQTAK